MVNHYSIPVPQYSTVALLYMAGATGTSTLVQHALLAGTVSTGTYSTHTSPDSLRLTDFVIIKFFTPFSPTSFKHTVGKKSKYTVKTPKKMGKL